METQRQRLSQLNLKLKQQRNSPFSYHQNQTNVASQMPLPNPPRPLPRQQARTKNYQRETIYPMSTTIRPETANKKSDSQFSKQKSDQSYITLANLTKILQMLQSRAKLNEYDTSTVMSSSTSHSAKPRGQLHLQETATRWWKPTRSAEILNQPPAPSSIARFSPLSRKPTESVQNKATNQENENLPLLTIVSNSARHTRAYTNRDNQSFVDENSESTAVDSSNLSGPKSINVKQNRHEPIIMGTNSNRLQSYKIQQNSAMQFFQQRLIRQT